MLMAVQIKSCSAGQFAFDQTETWLVAAVVVVVAVADQTLHT